MTDPSPPRHIVVLAHPAPSSFNATVAAAYCDTVRECGHEAVLRDLYAINFDPVLKDAERPGTHGFTLSSDVRDELATISGGSVFTLVYPIWFGGLPAMMKGYVDRVLGAGVTARAVQDRSGVTPVKECRMLSIISSGARDIWLDEQGQVEALRTVFGHYLLHAFQLKSYEDLHVSGIVEGFPKNFIDQNLRDVRDRARQMCKAVDADPMRSQPLGVAWPA